MVEKFGGRMGENGGEWGGMWGNGGEWGPVLVLVLVSCHLQKVAVCPPRRCCHSQCVLTYGNGGGMGGKWEKWGGKGANVRNSETASWEMYRKCVKLIGNRRKNRRRMGQFGTNKLPILPIFPRSRLLSLTFL